MTTLKFRRATNAVWESTNPILAQGEPGYVTDTGVLRLGDGVTHWNDLPEFADAASLNNTTRQVAREAAPVAAVTPDASRAFPGLLGSMPTCVFDPGTGIIPNERVWPVLADNTGAAKWSGPVTVTTDGATGQVAPSHGAYGATPAPIMWEFASDAPTLAMRGSFHNGSPIYIEVDGKKATTLPLTPDNANLLMIFRGRKLRRFKVFAGDGFHLASIVTGPTDSVFPIEAQLRPVVAWFGDSFSQGGPSGTDGSFGLPYITASALGWALRMSADGGSGWQTITSGNPNQNTIANRVTMYDDIDVSAAVFVAGINDDATGLQASATATLARFQSAHPNIPIFVAGPWSPSTPYETANTAKWTAIQAAATATPGAHYIDTRGWTFGTGYVGNEKGDGNADIITGSDATHPTRGVGVPFLATRLAFAIADILATGV